MKHIVKDKIEKIEAQIDALQPDLDVSQKEVQELELKQIDAVQKRNEIYSEINGLQNKRNEYINFLNKYEQIEQEEAETDTKSSEMV